MSRGKGDAFQRRRDRDSGGRKARVPSQAAKGKACTAAAGSGAEHCGSPGGRKWTVACKRTRAARPLTRRAESTRRSAARPKRGAEIPGSRRARCAERLSTEFGKRGRRRREGREGRGRHRTQGPGRELWRRKHGARFAGLNARRPARRQAAPPAWPARASTASCRDELQHEAGGREWGKGGGLSTQLLGSYKVGVQVPPPPRREGPRPARILYYRAMP